MDYYLPEHRPPDKSHRDWIAPGEPGYPPNHNIDLVVIHTAESGNDWDGDDSGAERVARYFTTADLPVSAHCAVDTDSRIDLLPTEWIAFHVKGYNSRAWGIELCLDAGTAWATIPNDLRDAILDRTAKACAEVTTAYKVPIIRLVGDEARAAGSRGITGHTDLDPTRRTDPGADFPWDEFIDRLAAAHHRRRETIDAQHAIDGAEIAEHLDNRPATQPDPPPTPPKSKIGTKVTKILGDRTITTEYKRGGYTRRTVKHPRNPELVGLHSRSPAVAVLKSTLIAAGYLDPRAARRPNLADARTIAALRDFQTDNHLDPTGEVNAETARALARVVPQANKRGW